MRQVDLDLWIVYTDDGPVTVLDYAPSSGELYRWAHDQEESIGAVRVHQETVTVVLTNNTNEGEQSC